VRERISGEAVAPACASAARWTRFDSAGAPAALGGAQVTQARGGWSRCSPAITVVPALAGARGAGLPRGWVGGRAVVAGALAGQEDG